MQKNSFPRMSRNPEVETENDRTAYVRAWIARRVKTGKKAGAGLVGAILTLPALAAAQVREGVVNATDIEGVTDVEVMPDGSAQLEMGNGVTISVPAEDVQVAANGQILVSERLVDIAAEVMAAGGGGAGIGGAALAGGLGVAGAAALAGGGDGDGSTPPPTINAQVLSAGGGLNNENTGVDLPDGTETVEVTVTDEDGNETTTTVTADEEGGWTLPEPVEGFPEGEVEVTVRSLDGDGEEIDTESQDVIIDTVPPEIAITDTGVGADGVLNIAEQDAGITVSGTTDAEDGQTVTVTLSTAAGDVVETTATANGGQWSVDIAGGDLAGIADGETVDVEATVEDAAGNPADSPATASFDADLAGPEITIDPISGDDQIGLIDAGDTDGLVVTGTTTAEVGQDVTLTLNGQDYTGAVVSNGLSGGRSAWEVTVPQSALQALQDAAGADELLENVPVSATVSDAAGNPAPTPATTTIDADFSGPSIAIDPITGDNVINSAEAESDVTISGTTNNVGGGQTVSVTVDGTDLADVQTDQDGNWTATLPQADADALTDGVSVDVTAEVTDPDGLPASTTVQLAADFTAPTVAINTVSGDDVINAQEGDQPLSISGTSSGAAEGQMVTLGLPGQPDQMASVDADGTWSLVLSAEQTGLLVSGQDGTTLDITANLSDAAGNPAPEATRTVDVDLSGPDITIDTVEAGGSDLGSFMNIAESGEDLTIGGTTTGAEANQQVTVAVGGETYTTQTDGTNWSLTIANDDLPDLTDGAETEITADVSDAAGNPAPTAETGFTVDLSPPGITIDTVEAGTDALGPVMNIAESNEDLTIGGTTSGVGAGQQVTVNVAGQDFTTTTDGSAWSLTIANDNLPSLADEATVDITASVIDAAENPEAEATTSFDTDLTAPNIDIDSVSAGGTLTVDELADGLTVTGTASPETTGNNVTVTIDGNDFTGAVQQDDGSWTVALDEAQLTGLNLADETNFDLTAAVSDDAGNPSAPATQTLTTDFQPIVTIDPIGDDGAVDLSDPGTPQITGTALGTDGTVTVAATDPGGEILNETANVDPDGTWTLDVPQATIDALDAGESITVTANATNAAGRAAPEASAEVDVYLASTYAYTGTEMTGNTLTVTGTGLENLDVSNGIEVQTTISFDTAQATYVEGSENALLGFAIANSTNAASGDVEIGVIDTNSPTLPADIYEFQMTDQGTGPITLDFVDAAQGGPTELQIGTANADTLTSGNTDSVLQGKGGDDTLDVSDTGANVVLFQPDQAANGTDTVTGFTTGDTFQADVIAFVGQADLRGAGDTVEALSDGEALGADTGFVIFTTELGDTAAGTLESAFEGLTGEAAGDTVYFLAGDGNDAALVRADVNGNDDASVEVMAEFQGIGDLAALNTDNVVLPDPVMNG